MEDLVSGRSGTFVFMYLLKYVFKKYVFILSVSKIK